MPILDDGVGQQDREGKCALGEQGDEDQGGTGFRNDPDQDSDDQHEEKVGLDPSLNVDVGIEVVDGQEHAKRPQEDSHEVALDHMFPEVPFQEVVRHCVRPDNVWLTPCMRAKF